MDLWNNVQYTDGIRVFTQNKTDHKKHKYSSATLRLCSCTKRNYHSPIVTSQQREKVTGRLFLCILFYNIASMVNIYTKDLTS